MSPEQEFDTRLAAIHGLDTLHTGSHNPGGNALDVRHAEFRAMTDIFLGENCDRRKVEQVESLQMALHEQQAVLYQRYAAEELGPEAYVEAFNTLLDETFVKCEDILGQEDFRKLFGAPRSELAGFIDTEAFLRAHQTPVVASTGPTNMSQVSESLLLALLDQASDEIGSYRQRQINTFREAVIVQALITWGVNQLQLQPNIYTLLIRISAALTCLAAGIIGCVIIMSYKKRIYYIRDKRARLVKRIQEMSQIKFEDFELFYPINKEKVEKNFQTNPTSVIYSLTLIITGILSFLVNILAGRAMQ